MGSSVKKPLHYKRKRAPKNSGAPDGQISGWHIMGVAEDGTRYETSTPAVTPPLANHLHSQPQAAAKRPIALDTGDRDLDTGPTILSGPSGTRPTKRPRAQYAPSSNENAAAASTAPSDVQNPLPAHSSDFVIGRPPPISTYTDSATARTMGLSLGRLWGPGRGAVPARRVIPRMAVNINIPSLLAYNRRNLNFTGGPIGSFQPGDASRRPPHPDATSPSADPSSTGVNAGPSAHAMYAEHPLDPRTRRARQPSPYDPPATTQPLPRRLQLGQNPGFQFSCPLRAENTDAVASSSPAPPIVEPAVLVCAAEGYLQATAAPAVEPVPHSDTPHPVPKEPTDIDEVIADLQAYFTRGFLGDLAPTMAQYREQGVPEDYWEMMASFVSDTNGGLSPELREVVERCRKYSKNPV